ncbi:hypothetical protein [Kitasatospora sp. NPDC050463]|uniref:hypothetical protein n=1 Tax=Kitasatospora sp. NPDC050463 TaxID=3155786 RepID=UPI0033DCDF60
MKSWSSHVVARVDSQRASEGRLAAVFERLTVSGSSIEYSREPGWAEEDLVVLAELKAVQLDALRALADGDAVAVDRLIRSETDALRARIGLLARLRAVNLNEAYGRGRGAHASPCDANGTPVIVDGTKR